MTKIVTVYELYNTDYDGRKQETIGYYSRNPEKGVFQHSKPRSAVEVDGELYLLEKNAPIDLDGIKAREQEIKRQQALDKLNDEDKKMLGLN